jgi:hypothetical protein
MESFTAMGKLSFRTRCMDIERAGRFARCLLANATRFTEVEICESKRARGEERWFVCFLPISLARQAAMVDRQQRAREVRAATQTFTVVADPDADFLHVYSHHSQETYEVSIPAATCSCPDQHYRGGANLVCKHLLAAADAVRRGDVGGFEVIPSAPEAVYAVTELANLCDRCAPEYGLETEEAARIAAPCDDCGRSATATSSRRAFDSARFAEIFG